MTRTLLRLLPLLCLILAVTACSTRQTAWDPNKTSSPRQQQAGEPAPSVYGAPSAAAKPSVLPPTQGTPESAKVAILLPLTGPNAALGQSMLQAAQLAVFDVGFDDFELISRDTGGTASGATAAARDAISSGAQLILGPLFAEEVRAVKAATSGTSVNVLAYSTDWTLAGGNTYIMGFLPFLQVERIAEYAKQQNIDGVAVSSPLDQYGITVGRAFEQAAERNGLRVSRALSDASSYNAVFIPASGDGLETSMVRVTNKSARKLGTGLWDDPRVAANPMMDGAWYAAPSPRARAGFEQRYQATYGSAPQRLATLAYDSTALAAALAKSAPDIRTAFSAASLTNPNGFAGVDGILRFGSNGLIERGMAVMEIRGGRAVEIAPAPTSFRN